MPVASAGRPRVEDGRLWLAEAGAEPIRVGSPAWLAWLAANDTFRFVDRAGTFSARKERRRAGDGYWKAYRRRSGRLHTAYLGQSTALTNDRLTAAAQTLAMRASADTPVADGFVAIPRLRFYIPPRPAGRIARPRLLARLRAAGRPIALLSAPTGYGKTTLVADWLSTDHLRTAWISLEPADDDPVRFWMVVAAGIEVAVPGAGRAALLQLRQTRPPIAHGVLPRLVDDLLRNLGPARRDPELVVVLDDLQVIGSPAVLEAVTRLAELLPPQVRLIVISQRDPALPIARWRAEGRLTELRARDLAFSAAESVAFLRRELGPAVPEADLVRLAAQTEGWAAALRLAALAMADGGGTAADLAFGGEHRHVVDYLVAEVLAHQPPDVASFLTATSVLDRLCGGLVDAVLARVATQVGAPAGPGTGQDLLQRVEAANLFLVPLDSTRGWYRYHALFAEALRQRLRLLHPHLEAEIQLAASAWYEAAGRLGEAIELALAAGAWARAARLVEQASDALWGRGESIVLARWLAALPEPLRRARPRLALAQANLLMWQHEHGQAAAWLDAMSAGLAAERAAAAAGGEPTPWPPTATVQARGAVLGAFLGRQADAAEAYAEGLRAMAALSENDRHWRAIAQLLLAEIARQMGRLDEAELHYGHAAAAAQQAGNVVVTLSALSLCARCLAERGRFRQAARQWQHARQLARTWQAEELPAVAFHDTMMAYVHYERNELDQADALATASLRLLTEGGSPVWVAYAQLTLARIRAAQGQADEAVRLLDASQAPFTGSARDELAGAIRQTYVGYRIQFLLGSGDAAAARRWARSPEVAEPVPWRTGGANGTGAAYLGVARARLVAGDPTAALEILARVKGDLAPAEGNLILVRAMVLEALSLELLGRARRADAVLGAALAMGQAEGHVRPFVDEGPALAAMLRRATLHGTAKRQARTVLAAFEAPARAHRRPPGAQHGQPIPLTARELDVLRLIGDGLTNRAIAARLGLAESTVKWHCGVLYDKLGAASRAQAIARAHRLGWLG